MILKKIILALCSVLIQSCDRGSLGEEKSDGKNIESAYVLLFPTLGIEDKISIKPSGSWQRELISSKGLGILHSESGSWKISDHQLILSDFSMRYHHMEPAASTQLLASPYTYDAEFEMLVNHGLIALSQDYEYGYIWEEVPKSNSMTK